MRKSHVRRLGQLKQSSSLTPMTGSQPQVQSTNPNRDSRALASDSSIRFSTCAQSTPKRPKISIDDDADPFADDEILVEKAAKSPSKDSTRVDCFKQPLVTNVTTETNLPTIKTSENKTFMDNILVNCKFYLKATATGAHLMKTDKTHFLREIERILKQDSNDTLFLNDFKKYHLDSQNLELSFAPTKIELEDESDVEGEQGSVQDSLIRLLLHVGLIQSRLIIFLTEKVKSIIMTHNKAIESVTWVGHLIRSLSYLGVIHDSKSLCEQLLDLIETANSPMIKREIIAGLPDILNFDVHSVVAVKLSNLLQDDESLMPVILETLSILSLTEDILTTVQSATILSMKRATLDALPAMVKFLISTCGSSYDEVINGIRLELTFESNSISRSQMPLSVQKNAEKKLRVETQKKVFSCIKDEMLFNKTFLDAWLKTFKIISKKNSSLSNDQARPIDLMMMIIMYCSCQSDKNKESVIKVFRTLILTGKFTSLILKDSLALYIPVIKEEEYFMALMKIMSHFMRSSERSVILITTELMSQLMQYLQSRYVTWLLRDLVSIIGCGESSSVHHALAILEIICLSYKDKVQPMSSIVMILLNKLEDFSLVDMRQVLNILSFLSHSEDDIVSGDIHILVQKKLSSVEVHSLRIGVIGAALMMKQLALVSSEDHNSLSTDISDHSTNSTLAITQRASKALDLLKSVMHKLRNRGSVVLGLFYDQLSCMLFRENNIDVTFKVKVADFVKTELKKNFFADRFETKNLSDTLRCSTQFCLNGNLSINISELLVQGQSNCNDKVICLPVLMRLLRVSDYLPNIDNLIDAGLILTERNSYEANSFSDLSSHNQEVVLSSLFIAINWFIEILNCFSNTLKKRCTEDVPPQSLAPPDSSMSKKILLRLQQLVFMQQMLCQLLPLLSSKSYTPPRAYFHVDVKNPLGSDKSKVPKTSQKDSAAKSKKSSGTKRKCDDTLKSTCPDTSAAEERMEDLSMSVEEEGKPNVLQTDMKLYQSYFREMETDVWLILKEDFILVPTAEKDGVFSGQLGPAEYLFIISDAVRKLEWFLPSTVKKVSALKSVTSSEKTLGFDHLDTLKDIGLIQKYISILPSLCKHTSNISTYLHRTWTAFDKIDDVPALFEPEVRVIKICLAQLFRSMSLVFSWTGFQTDPTGNPNVKYLLNGLCVFTKCGRPDIRMTSKNVEDLKDLVSGSVEYLSTFHEYIAYLPAAVSYTKLLRALSDLAPDMTSIQVKISEIVWHFLTTRWYTLTGAEEKGAIYCGNVEFLLVTHFQCARGALSHLNEVFANLINDIDQLTDQDSRLSTIVTIGKSNLHILIRCLCKGILNEVKHKMKSGDTKEILESWLKAFDHMDILVKALKDKLMHKSKTNLIAFLQQSKEIFKLFIKEGFYHLSGDNFVTENDLVCKILKKLQVSTRYIQNICNHTKKMEDLQLSKDLPIMKQMMEIIILRVSSVMKENKCGDAIQVACLRVRDAAGQEIDIGEDSDDSSSEEEEREGESPPASPANNSDNESDAAALDNNSELSDTEIADSSNTF